MMHGFCKPGTSLTQTLESHRLAQKIIMENFPDEVKQVISKIGSAEIPTDPMAPETANNVILLKPKEQWKRAETKEELVEMIEAKVYDVPGMAFEFTQPIKMHFDEMMTGVRCRHCRENIWRQPRQPGSCRGIWWRQLSITT